LLCQIPRCLIALQHSVYAVLIGRTRAPDWLTHGIPQTARTASAVVSLVDDARRPAAAVTSGTSITSDGCFLYVHDPVHGLLKIGCGFGNTIMVGFPLTFNNSSLYCRTFGSGTDPISLLILLLILL